MKFTLLGLLILAFSLQSQAKERRWQCTGKDDKELFRIDKSNYSRSRMRVGMTSLRNR